MNKKNLLLLLLPLLIVMACRDKEPPDFREQLVGTYQGEESYSYYYIDELDTPRTVTDEGSSPQTLTIDKGTCEECVAIVFDTLATENGTELITDTLEFTETNKFEGSYILIGDNYYREYSVVFDTDSLHVDYFWVKEDESYRYEFKGMRSE